MADYSATSGSTKYISKGELFSIACVWFSTHVGGGFATGNQIYQYFVKFGWVAALMPLGAMLLLAWTLRESLILARSQNITTYKDFFRYLWQPYPQLSHLFELFYYTIMIAAVSIAIAGAASLLKDIGIRYELAVLISGSILFVLTIFGSGLLKKAATVMSIGILIACAIIYFVGISAKSGNLVQAMTPSTLPLGVWPALVSTIIYASFQVVTMPSIIACAGNVRTMKAINTFFWMGLLMNGVALTLGCWLLMAWLPDMPDMASIALPNLAICTAIGYPWLYWCYFFTLFLAFVSTGVTCIFGLVTRLENNIFKNSQGFFKNITMRRALVSFSILVTSMSISFVGLSKLVKYGYGLCGYLSIAVIMIPILTIGYTKNRRFIAANPDFFAEK